MAGMVRLDKFLCDRNMGTRSQIKEMAKKGRILVNGVAQKKTEIKIDPLKDLVTLDGQAVAESNLCYWMLHKPQGVVTATRDHLHKTVMDLMGPDCGKDCFPVGRLDLDTEGLLLITNDGELAHSLLSPRRHVDKTYLAHVTGSLPKDAGDQFFKGLTLKDSTPTMPARLEIISVFPTYTLVHLTIQEGKFHQVKRMFEALNCQVTYLKRLSMGPLSLDETLKPGTYRPLTEEEIKQIKDKNHVNQ